MFIFLFYFFIFVFWLGLVPRDEPGTIFRACRFSRHKMWPARLLSGVEVNTEVRGNAESTCKIQLQHTERINTQAAMKSFVLSFQIRETRKMFSFSFSTLLAFLLNYVPSATIAKKDASKDPVPCKNFYDEGEKGSFRTISGASSTVPWRGGTNCWCPPYEGKDIEKYGNN